MKTTLLFCFSLCFTFMLEAQDFLVGSDRFSSKKISYLFLKDGSEVQGYIKDIDRKKGLIEEIVLKIDGKKSKFKPEDIDYMYLMPSGFDKFAKAYDSAFDLTEEEKDRSVNMGYIKEGYVLFESTEVMIKKKKRNLLLQLVNPGYNSKIRVYHDPLAQESMSAGIGGFKVAGGDKKSFYVKKGDAIAYRLKKKKYDDEWKELFKDCLSIKDSFDGKMKWYDFSKHVFAYTTECD